MSAEFQDHEPLTTDAELIAEGNKLDPTVTTPLSALNAIWGHGFADESSGTVEAPCGHFFRVEHWIVKTDSQGFSEVEAFDSVVAAMVAFGERDQEYAEWDDDDDNR